MTKIREYWKKWLRWDNGRQGGDYDKLLLFANPLLVPFDCYLLRFRSGSEIPPHCDEVENGRHFRLNIVLKKPKRGGEFVCADAILNWDRVKLFRSDRSTHSVTKVEGGTRYVLSIGWILP